MPLINSKVELKSRWTKHCVLASAGVQNDDADSNDIIFTIKDTKLYVPVVTLSAKDNQKLSIHLSKGFERSVYWNGCKTKNQNKNMTNEYRYLSNLVGVNRLFVFYDKSIDSDIKR